MLFCLFLLAGWAAPCRAKIYKYKDAQGNWHFTDIPPEGAQAPLEEEPGKVEAPPLTWDLDRYLASKLHPRNALERASNFTVTLKTPIGMGSGFFIDAAGSIVTNRHIFEGDKNRIAQTERLFRLQGARLETLKKELLLAASSLLAQQGLDKEPRFVQSLEAGDLDAFFTLYKDIERRDAAYRLNRERFGRWLKEYHDRQEKLEALKRKLEEFKRRAASPPAYVTVILADNTPFEAKFIAKSPDHDLALFRLSGYKTPRPQLGDAYQIPAGTRVFALGSPLGLRRSIAEGVFSALRRDEKGALIIQSTVKINKGNSGGPLVDEQGRVLGVNTAKVIRPGVEGISFSIAVNTVLEAFREHLK